MKNQNITAPAPSEGNGTLTLGSREQGVQPVPGSPHTPFHAGPCLGLSLQDPRCTLAPRTPSPPHLLRPGKFPSSPLTLGLLQGRSVVVVPQACWCWARRFWGWGGRGVCPGGLPERGSWQPEDAGWGQGRQHSGRKRSPAQGDVSKDSRQGWTEAGLMLGRLESGR